jgi:hypothetical protein
MPPVQMKVVDAQDGRPVAGAHVLFQAGATEGTWTGHGGKRANLFAVEAVTGEAGEFRLPAQEFSTQPFFLNTNFDSPSMVVLKPGYELLVLVHSVPPDASRKELSAWPYDKQTVKLKRASADAHLQHAADQAGRYAEMTMSASSMCSWKKLPRFFVAADRLAAEWNRRREGLADAALAIRSVRSPLQFILANESVFVEKGCGSPKAFFEPYLK